MRRSITFTLFVGTLVGLLTTSGCGSDKDRNFTTTAPVNSGTGPVNSSTPGGVTSGTPTNPPPTTTYLDDALVSSFVTDEVVEVDGATGNVMTNYAVGQGPTDVQSSGTMAYVANGKSQEITVIDRLANNTVGTVDVTGTPIAGTSLLSVLDPLLKPLVRPTGVAASPNGDKIYSANLLNVTIIDGNTLQPTKSILGLNNSLSLSSIISNPSQALQNFLAAPVRGLGMAKVAATDDHALVTCMISGTVMRIDGQTDDLIDYVDVGRAPIGITVANGKAYVACALSQEIWVVDVQTGNVVTTLQGNGMLPVDCSANQAEDRVYVANVMSGDIEVIDTAADIVVDTIPSGLQISSIFQQLGITLPSSGSGGIGGLLNNFLAGFTGGLANPSSFGNLLAGGSGGGLLSPGSLINGLITAFLGFAGLNQQQIGSISFPGLLSCAAAHDPDKVLGSTLMGDLAMTEVQARSVSSHMTAVGPGLTDVAGIWTR